MPTHLRPLHPNDIPTLATLAAHTFQNDTFFAWLYPDRATRFDAFRLRWLQSFKRAAVTRAQLCWVAVEGLSADDPDAQIAGAAVWRRELPDAAADSTALAWRNVNSSVACALERAVLALEDRYLALTNASGGHRGRLALLERSALDWRAVFASHGLASYWWLDFLFVAPAHQRKGVGEMLVKWGLQRAEEEGVPAGLISSVPGRKLYGKLGFRVVEWDPTEVGLLEDGTGVTDAEGGQGMVWGGMGTVLREVEGDAGKEGEGEGWVWRRGKWFKLDAVWIQ